MHAFFPASLASLSWTTVDVLNHLWQSTAVGLAVLGLLIFCRGLSARTRYALGWLALAKFALPMAALARLARSVFGASDRWLASQTLTLPVDFSSRIFVVTADPQPTRNLAGLVIGAVWLAGFVALAGFWLMQSLRLRRRILATAKPVSATMAQRIAQAAERVGLRAVPRCVTVTSEQGPGVLGVFSPMVILPRGLEDELSAAELEAVLLHELVHLRRRDPLWNAVSFFGSSVLWFNPVVWLLHRRIRLETEQACDERVLEITGDPDTYAGGIVKCVRYALGIATPGLAGAATPPVVSRLKNIFAHGTRPRRPWARGAALGAGVLLLALSGHAGTFTAEALRAVPSRVAAPAVAPTTPAIASLPAEKVVATLPALPEVAVAIAPAAEASLPAPSPVSTPEPAVSATPVAVAPTPVSAETVVEPAPPPAPVLAPIPAAVAADESVAPRLYSIRELDRAPKPISQVAPQYPTELREKNISGEVTVGFVVDTNGAVLSARADKSTRAEFELSAVEAVSAWKFEPGRKDGHAVNTVLVVPILFQVTEDSPAEANTQAVPAVATGEGDALRINGERVYDISKLDRMPSPKSQVAPKYPAALRRSRIAGEALVDFIVDTKGAVRNAHAIESTHREFGDAAVAAVSKWIFRPGLKNSRTVNTHMQVPIIFSLTED